MTSGRRVTVLVAVLTFSLAVLAGCGSKGHTASKQPTTSTTARSTTTSSSTTTTTVPASTTTTVAVPPAPQPSAEEAAQTLINGWEAGNQQLALRVATHAAVATLFAAPYGGQEMVARGCTDAFPPLYCSYGPPGGGSGDLYELEVTSVHGRWYISSVTVEH